MSERRCGRHAAQALAALGVAAVLAPSAPATAHAEEGRIVQDLTSGDLIGLTGDGSGLRVRGGEAARGEGASLDREEDATHHGTAVFPGHPLEEGTDTVDVRLGVDGDPGDLLAEARGVREDGMWTEWRTVPEGGGRVALPREVEEVQLRVEVEGTDSALTELDVRPLPSSGAAPGAREREKAADPSGPDPFSARLFATRIGLEGHTTANGHVIAADDHFAALPSRRGLANRGGGEYTVRVCSTGEYGPDAEGDPDTHDPRCVYVPVWDVGPWNITDDHWNEDRESWNDLDRGRPQAQAAYAQGHNGGLDGFGRRVANPAGIDLADGAFNQGLQMPTNGWVEVDYLWTDDHAHRAEIVTESNSEPVVVREGPGAEHNSVGLAAPKAVVDVHCSVTGDEASGPYGTGDTWYRIGEGHYVPGAFAAGAGGAPECPEP